MQAKPLIGRDNLIAISLMVAAIILFVGWMATHNARNVDDVVNPRSTPPSEKTTRIAQELENHAENDTNGVIRLDSAGSQIVSENSKMGIPLDNSPKNATQDNNERMVSDDGKDDNSNRRKNFMELAAALSDGVDASGHQKFARPNLRRGVQSALAAVTSSSAEMRTASNCVIEMAWHFLRGTQALNSRDADLQRFSRDLIAAGTIDALSNDDEQRHSRDVLKEFEESVDKSVKGARSILEAFEARRRGWDALLAIADLEYSSKSSGEVKIALSARRKEVNKDRFECEIVATNDSGCTLTSCIIDVEYETVWWERQRRTYFVETWAPNAEHTLDIRPHFNEYDRGRILCARLSLRTAEGASVIQRQVVPENAEDLRSFLMTVSRSCEQHKQDLSAYFYALRATDIGVVGKDLADAERIIRNWQPTKELLNDFLSLTLSKEVIPVRWKYRDCSGVVAFQFDSTVMRDPGHGLSPEEYRGGRLATLKGKMFDPDSPTECKSIEGTVQTWNDRYIIVLGADPATGIDARSSENPCTRNLLVRRDSRGYSFKVMDGRIIGEDTLGTSYELTVGKERK